MNTEKYTEPVRQIGKQKVPIIMPFYKDVLANNFDYSRYADQFCNDFLEYQKGNVQGYFKEIDKISLTEMLTEKPCYQKPDEIELQIRQINSDFCHRFYMLQHQFEEAFKKGRADAINDQITNEMKTLTSEYSLLLDTLDDTRKLDATAQRYAEYVQELNAATQRYENTKESDKANQTQKIKLENLQRQSLERIQAFHDGLITFADLTGYDINNLPFQDRNYKTKARTIISKTYDMVPNYQEYTIGELYSLYISTNSISNKKGHKK